MVIAKVSKSLYGDLSPGGEVLEAILGRIKHLVTTGHLLAQGNLSNWRFSEVRLPGDGN